MGRRLLVWGVLLVAMALLAFWLQSPIEDVCIVPAIDLLRRSGLFLKTIPQWVYWSLLVAGVALIALSSLTATGRLHNWRPAKEEQAAVPGPIGKLAQYIHNTRRGPYFKWLVAHTLGEVAQAILIQRDTLQAEENAQGERHGLKSKVPAQMAWMAGRDWDAQCPAEIQAYLEAGLDRAPMTHPRKRSRPGWPGRFFSRRLPTPLDLDPSQVVEYLSPSSPGQTGREGHGPNGRDGREGDPHKSEKAPAPMAGKVPARPAGMETKT